MKRILFFVVAAAMLTACGGGDKPKPEPDPTLTITPSLPTIEFAADGEDVYMFEVETNQDEWSVESSQPTWCTVEMQGTKFFVTAKPNLSENAPEMATITVTAGTAMPITFTATQLGKEPVIPDPDPTNIITVGGVTRNINYAGIIAGSPANCAYLVFSSKPFGSYLGDNCDYLAIQVPTDLNGQVINLATGNTEGVNWDISILHANGLFTNVDIYPRNDHPTGTYYVNKVGTTWTVTLTDVASLAGKISVKFEGTLTDLSSSFDIYNTPAFTSTVKLGSGGSYSVPAGKGYVSNYPSGSNVATDMYLFCENETDFFEIDLKFYHASGTLLTSGTYTYATSKASGTFGNTVVDGDYSMLFTKGNITGGTITVDATAGTLTFNNCTTSKTALGTINGTITFNK